MKTCRTILLFVFALLVIGALFSQPVITTNITVLSGQQTATSTATNLGNNVIKTLCVKALDGNTGTVYLGGSNVTTGNGMELIKDQSWCPNVSNTNSVYLIGTGGGVSWIGTK